MEEKDKVGYIESISVHGKGLLLLMYVSNWRTVLLCVLKHVSKEWCTTIRQGVLESPSPIQEIVIDVTHTLRGEFDRIQRHLKRIAGHWL